MARSKELPKLLVVGPKLGFSRIYNFKLDVNELKVLVPSINLWPWSSSCRLSKRYHIYSFVEMGRSDAAGTMPFLIIKPSWCSSTNFTLPYTSLQLTIVALLWLVMTVPDSNAAHEKRTCGNILQSSFSSFINFSFISTKSSIKNNFEYSPLVTISLRLISMCIGSSINLFYNWRYAYYFIIVNISPLLFMN